MMQNIVTACLFYSFFVTPAFCQNIISSKHAPKYKILNGKGVAKLFFNETTGAKEAALSQLTLFSGASVAEHVHENSAEFIYITEGKIKMTINGKELAAKKGDAIYIPSGVKHSAHVPKKIAVVKAVQVYVGPGPEQRFTKEPIR